MAAQNSQDADDSQCQAQTHDHAEAREARQKEETLAEVAKTEDEAEPKPFFNEFEWIVSIRELFPILKSLCPNTIICVGCGSSRIEELEEIFDFDGKAAGVSDSTATRCSRRQIIGLDIDASEIENARKRYEYESRNASQESNNRPKTYWRQCDLTETEIDVASLLCNEANAQFLDRDAAGVSIDLAQDSASDQRTLILDKGTLDYIVCGEISGIVEYMLNMLRLACGGHYVLISFRNPTMLKGIVTLFNFELVREELFGEASNLGSNAIDETTAGAGAREISRTEKPGQSGKFRCYVFKVAAGAAAAGTAGTAGMENLDRPRLEHRIREVMDAYYKNSATVGMIEIPSDAGAARGAEKKKDTSVEMNTTGESESQKAHHEQRDLESAYREWIPADLKAEYTWDFFLEDLAISHPSCLQTQLMSRSEMREFLMENQ